MEILICVKQVPDDSVEIHLGADGQPDLSKADPQASAFETYAQELAVRYVEANGGTVTAVSVGPDDNKTSLKNQLAVGAANAYLVSDPAFDNIDGEGVAKVLAASVPVVEDKVGSKFDLILCGKESTDYIDGHVGPILAEKLGLPFVSNVVEVEPSDGGVKVKQETDSGYVVYEVPTPAVLTISKPNYDPRYPTIKSKMKARKAEIPVISAADIGLDAAAVAPKVEVVGYENPPKKAPGVKINEKEIADSVAKAMDIVFDSKVL